jgi:hypothetical protein
VIPWEFLLLFSQGYDSAAFSAAAIVAGMVMGAGPTATTQALRMRDSSMFYFNISINYCAGSK